MSIQRAISTLAISTALALPAMASDYLSTQTRFTDDNATASTRVVFVAEDQTIEVEGWSSEQNQAVARAAEIEDFTGAASQLVTLVAPAGTQANHLMLAGVGNPAELSRFKAEKLGAAIAAALKPELSDVVFDTRLITNPGVAAEISAQVAHGIDLRNYRFDRYQSEPKARPQTTYHWVTQSPKVAEKHYQNFRAIAEGVFVARDITALPGSDGYPEAIVKLAQQAMQDLDIDITVITPEQVKEMGMGLLESVSAGSQHGSYLLAAHYKGSDDAPIALVGKGNTFDTGGYNLKTSSSSILRMQTDKAGAGAVIGTVMALAKQQAPVNVVAIAPLSHNLISGSATLPGDVVKAGDGTLVEIANTDAEGRLILGDALTRASEEKPDLIIDFATLTGAARVALGPEYPALMTRRDDTAQALIEAGRSHDDEPWRLPLPDVYREWLASDIADTNNAHGNAFAGASVAGLFLDKFVGEGLDWAHFDTFAWRPSAKPGRPKGGDAYGLRAAFHMLKARYGGT